MNKKEILRIAYIVHELKGGVQTTINGEDIDLIKALYKTAKPIEKQWLYDLLKLLDEEVWNI